MGNRLFASAVAVLLAIIAVYYQELSDKFYLSPNLKVVDSARDITYLGSLSHAGIEHFQNIFYAEEPTGLRRFAAPVPTKPVRGSVIDATRAGAWCPQGTGDILPFTSSVSNISENCLSLRIARPAGTRKGAKLPVVVWIHGGKSTVCKSVSAK
jgi:carboxylesterase type B